jgi:uncharacterized SAM-binding protein YcdF (DUF218 family)
MYFYASKILGFFAIPSNVVIVVGLLGAFLLRTRYARTGWRLAIGSLVLLAILGLSPVGNALILPLEQRFPAWEARRGPPDGIIVLGGALSPQVSAARNTVALNEAAERMTATVALARRYPNARIVFSGGTAALIPGSRTEAEFALHLFEQLGVAKDRLAAEDHSRNTFENAVFAKALIKPRPSERWLLVTSAYHMPRSIGAFRKVGFDVEAHPVDWRTRGPSDAVRPFDVLSDGLRRTDTAVHEWVGLLIYWLTGKSSELFPGPRSHAAAKSK